MKRLMKGISLAIALGLAAGCTTMGITTPPGSQAFRAGFRDGCDSGYAAAGNTLYRAVKDENMAASKQDYGVGWSTGFNECEANFARIQRTGYLILGP